MKNKILIVLGVLLAVVIGVVIYFAIALRPVIKESTETPVSIPNGTSKIEIAKKLKKDGLVRSQIATLAYLFFNPKANLQAGDYTLDKSKSTTDIIKQIINGDINEVIPTVRITFVEGKRFVDYAKQISDNFEITYEDIISKGADKEFLNSIIKDYWFIDESILNSNIYYPLEGYLAADTYEFYQTSDIETIFRKMLNVMDQRLTPLKNDIQNSKYSVHEILTIASIVEKEAVNKEDRAKVSQVIYTRLDKGMALGMDVTTYYAVFKEMKDTLLPDDIASSNAYNTRNNDFIGLPASSICSPSLESINAALHPSDTNYVYFIADVATGKVYFTESVEDFLKLKQELMQ